MAKLLLVIITASFVIVFIITMSADGTEDTNKTRCSANVIKLVVSFIGMISSIGIECLVSSPKNVQSARISFMIFTFCAIVSAFKFGFYFRGEVEEDYKSEDDNE